MQPSGPRGCSHQGRQGAALRREVVRSAAEEMLYGQQQAIEYVRGTDLAHFYTFDLEDFCTFVLTDFLPYKYISLSFKF